MVRKITPAVSSPYVQTHQAGVSPCPKGASHSHWVLWLLCSNWGVLTLQELTASPTKEGSESNRSQALLLHQCRGISAGVMSGSHMKERLLGPLLQGCCVSLHTGEASRVAAERTGMFISRHKMFGLSTSSVQQLCSFSAFSVLTRGHGYRAQMDGKGSS